MPDRTVNQIQQHLNRAQTELSQVQQLLIKLSAPSLPAGSKLSRYPHFKMLARQDKGLMFESALQEFGYESVHDWRKADFILADHDQRGDTARMQRDNKSFFIHPHSARSMILWDGILPVSSFVKCNFVFAPGHKQVMLQYGYPRPIEVVGWTYCDIQPFTPSPKITKVLFAPIHPNQTQDAQGRRLIASDVALNRKVYDILRALPFDLTVRYSGELKDNGLEPCGDVTFQVADLTLKSSLEAIQAADFIVGHQTFAHLSIASGKPTVMFGEDTPPHAMLVQVKSWNRYKNVLRYPLDLLQGDPMQILEQAASSDESIRAWRDNFIGEPFNPKQFVELVEKYLG